MRIFPILTAIAVVSVLYLFVFERDALRAFAGYEPESTDSAGADASNGPGAVAAEAGKGVSVIAVESVAREIDNAVVLRGRTEAARELVVQAETSGKVTSPARAKGSAVEAGELLCEIEMGTRQASLAQAEAARAEAALALRNAETLSADGFAAETRVIGARAAMSAAEAAVAAAEREIARTRIVAPFAGVLESDTAEPGTLLQPGSPCATVIDLDPVRLVGFVAEVDVDRIEIGAMAGARLASGREVAGRVTFLSRAADPATRTFRVEAEVANPGLAIRDGQTAEIAVQSSGTRAHLVPQSALTLDDAGTLGVRIADEADIARFVPVEMLRDTAEGVWVAGLDERVRLIVVGQDYVSDGVALDVTLREPGL